MSVLRVTEPIARNNDPITSFAAGENPEARINAEHAVTQILRGAAHHGIAFTAHEVITTAHEAGDRWTGQRLRTALKTLERKGIAVQAGKRAGGSPTGRSAMTWKLADR